MAEFTSIEFGNETSSNVDPDLREVVNKSNFSTIQPAECKVVGTNGPETLILSPISNGRLFKMNNDPLT